MSTQFQSYIVDGSMSYMDWYKANLDVTHPLTFFFCYWKLEVYWLGVFYSNIAHAKLALAWMDEICL